MESLFRLPSISIALEFLNGADFSVLEIAFSFIDIDFFEKVSQAFLRKRTYLGQKVHLKRDLFTFPASRNAEEKNWKFLYHLACAVPNIRILGEPYTTCSALEPRTDLNNIDHLKYITEKALRGGGLALCLNIFDRVWRAHKDADETALAKMAHMLTTPDPSTGCWWADIKRATSTSYLTSSLCRQNFEEFVFNYGVFHHRMRDHSYGSYAPLRQSQCTLINIIRRQFAAIVWETLLAESLAMSLSQRNTAAAVALKRAGASINLSGRIPNHRTCSFISEACDAVGRNTGGLQILIAIFSNCEEHEFEEEMERLSGDDLDSILKHVNKEDIPECNKLIEVLLDRRFLLQDGAAEVIQGYAS